MGYKRDYQQFQPDSDPDRATRPERSWDQDRPPAFLGVIAMIGVFLFGSGYGLWAWFLGLALFLFVLIYALHFQGRGKNEKATAVASRRDPPGETKDYGQFRPPRPTLKITPHSDVE